MALKTTVKISAVNNLSDARYCAGMGVELMGFQLEESADNYIDYQNFIELTGWVSGVEFVGEFTQSSYTTIKRHITQYDFKYVQITNHDLIESIYLEKKEIILKFNIDIIKNSASILAIMEKYKTQVRYFLFETDAGIYYKNHIVDEVLQLAQSYPILLGFNLNAENIEALVSSHPIEGIALRGGEEIRPGYKDFDEIADILEALEEDD